MIQMILLLLNQPLFARDPRRLGAIGGMKFFEDRRDMIFHGAFGQHQTRGDLLVAEALGQEAQHTALALAEPFVLRLLRRLAPASEFGNHARGDAGLYDARRRVHVRRSAALLCYRTRLPSRVSMPIATIPHSIRPSSARC